MNTRLKEIRKSLKYSQEEFGRRLGITGGGVSKIESGDRKLTEQMVLAVSREFGVNSNWLRTGNGEMLYVTNTSLAADFIKQHKLTGAQAALIEVFITLSDRERDAVIDIVHRMSQKALEAEHRAGYSDIERIADEFMADNKKAPANVAEADTISK